MQSRSAGGDGIEDSSCKMLRPLCARPPLYAAGIPYFCVCVCVCVSVLFSHPE